ncbi:hypothetical protein CI109_101219 [Kwoniella shandongensis]|uniref:Uncharacterized protein n=1 Tax=Kwoniella shandongensis TaxID=1734106 RepID=A0A5M6BXL8_9TREE|nr:uncharacterized protein CI109_005463 [Kwoniella shandongensis]KAA5526185.1 hypothetical protein CI109_005463 [Kwoniella shandongensis]
MSEPPQKRFKYASYNAQINNISVDVGKKRGLGWEKDEYDEDTAQTSTPFTAELDRLSQLDLTIPYQNLQRTLLPLTTTLPITLYNLSTIQETFNAFYEGLEGGQDNLHSGLDPALFLHQALYETCLSEAVSLVPETAHHLLRVGALRALDPKLVERTYSTLSLILRTIASALLKSDETAQSLLQQTWNEVRPYLRPRENKRYVRKCVADAWTGVIRKARSDGLQRLINLLLEDEQEGMEAVWANSLKGTSGQLHSRALPIYTILLERLANNPTTSQLTTINLVSTSLIHYTSSSVIKPVVEIVLNQLDVRPTETASTSSSPATMSLTSSAAVLNVLSTFLLTRRGKRFPESLLKPVMQKLQFLLPLLLSDASITVEALSEEERATRAGWRKVLVTCIVGALQAGQLTHWLSPGVSLIESLWEKLDHREAFAFVNSLVTLKWTGVEQFLLSHVAKTSLPALPSDPLSTLVLLNNLAAAGYLSGGLSNVQGGQWRQALISTLVSLLESLAQTGLRGVNDRRVLGQALKLLPALPSDAEQFTPHVASLLKLSLELSADKDSSTLRSEWKTAGAWNDSHLLGTLLRSTEHILASPKEGVEEDVKRLLVTEGQLNAILDKWSWNREIMEAIAPLVERWASDLSLSHDHVLELLMENLLSSDSELRQSSLQILTAIAPATIPAGPSDLDEDVTTLGKIWSQCTQIETSEMTLKNVRERTTNIARLSRTITSLSSQRIEEWSIVMRGVIGYLVAQLKVNFRPVYAETIDALAAVAEKQGETVWSIVWEQVQKANVAQAASMVDLDVVNPEWTVARRDNNESRRDEQDEDDVQYHCPNLEKGRNAVGKAWIQASDEEKLDQQEIAAQISHDRLDVLNYEAQLLGTLGAVHSLAEKHSRLIVPAFFSVAQQEIANEEVVSTTHLSTKQRQARTANYLELMTKFVNPKAAFRTDELHALYLTILSKGEPKLQGLALKCLLTYKSPKLLPYGEPMTALLDDSKFRDELTRFRLGVDSQDYAIQTQDQTTRSNTRVVVIDPPHRDEALPVIIRLLYGIITSRRGRSSTAQGQGARKQAVLTSLSGCSSEELGTLVDLMLEPFVDGAGKVSGRQQMGFLTLLTDVIRYLGPQIVPHWSRLISTTIELVANAQKRLTQSDVVVEDGQEDEEEVEADEQAETDKGLAPLRNIRSIGLKRLVQFFRSSVSTFDFTPYLPDLFSSIISPRLDRLEVENTQAPSGTLELIATLAVKVETARSLVQLDERTLPKAFACMTAVKVKPAVILKVFDIIDSLLIDEEDATITNEVLLPHIRVLLDHIIGLVASLKSTQNDEITRRLLSILSRLSVVVSDGQQAQQLATLLAPLLRQRKTTEKAKTNILSTLQRLYAISPDFSDPTSKFFLHSYELISTLLQSMFFPSSRRALVAVLDTFAVTDPTLSKSVKLVGDLNAYSTRRMEEPDFDRRLTAYASINDAADADLPSDTKAWLPILRTVLFFLQEPEELSIRTNASAVLQRFITLIGDAADGPYVDSLQHIIMPGLRKTLRAKQELVRNEALHVLTHAVKTCSGIPELAELRPLLADGDEEAAFFTNITHIQVHRRARALRRLRELAAEYHFRESTLTNIFLPVLEHIVAGATDITDHHLINEAILTIGGLARELRWSRWYGVIGRYMKLGIGSGKSAQQRYYVRAISAIIDGFHFDIGKVDAMEVDEQVEDVAQEKNGEVAAEEDEEKDDEVVEQGPTETSPEKITQTILNRLLPGLVRFVAQKEDSDSTIRIPLALGVVKIAHALPRASSDVEVLRVITTVSAILRSKEQDTRDIARETVCKIAVYLGPDWLVRVIKELETALSRGPQKHVLAVATHAILVRATTEASDRFADLDEAVELAVAVSAEVIWGESGKDVATEGFKTKMREVRGATSRGFDTFQLLSQLVSPNKIGAILAPLREVMHSSQAVKPMQQTDEALRRISLGFNSNSRLGPEDILSLCFSLISGNSSYLKPKRKASRPAETPDNFKVQMKRDVKGDNDFYALNAHKFVVFGLDLFVTAFRRGKFDFDDVSILSRLGPMVSAVGNTLYSPASNVLMLSLKATAAIVRCPVPQVEPALHVFITNIFKIIKHAGGTAESELAQTALKTLAVILRDCKSSQVTENQLKYLLEVISPDLEEPDRQAAIFTILRSIIARKFVVPEIYDLMERVSSIMVTSQSTHVQELCRGAVMAFLLDYPQGKGRLKSQMTFFARNLEYTYEAGRISVMEVLSAVFTKFSDELVEEYADMFFVALVVVLANDDSEKCRIAAGALLKLLWKRLDSTKQSQMVEVLKAWVGKREDNEVLASAALGVFGLLVDSPEGEGLIEDLEQVVSPIIEESAKRLAKAEISDDYVHLDHSLAHQSLSAIARSVLRSSGSNLETLPWTSIIPHLLFPHDWVRYDTAKLLANLFTTAKEGSACEMLGDETLLDIARKGCLVLKGSKSVDGESVIVSGKLADEVVKVLYNVSKYWATSEQVTEFAPAGEDEEDQEEPTKRRPLAWLMSRMSFLARHLIVNRPSPHSSQASEQWSAPVLSILRFFAGVYEALDPQQAKGFLIHILSPVYRILDEGGDLGTVDDSQIDELRQLATQIREFVQTKVGPTPFSIVWEKLRKATQSKREGRREDRVRMAVADPEKWAERKSKKVERGKEGKKRKIKAYADGKISRPNTKRRRE